MRRIIVSVVLAALLFAAVGAYVQAQRTDAASDPGWIEDVGPVPTAAGTPLLSARRVPGWLSAPISEARLAQRLSAAAASANAPEQTCLVVHRNGERVAGAHVGDLLAPSSLMTIVTGAVILEKAGPAATYTTEAFVRADALAAAADGLLIGDIYLVGRGDPVLSTPSYSRRFEEPSASTDFTELARRAAAALKQRGIAVVEGSVVADESRFPEEERDYAGHLPGPDGDAVWEQSVVNENAVGPLSALLLNDGYVSFSPSIDPVSNRQNVRTRDPARHAADVFGAMLQAQGVTVTAEPVKGVAPALVERVSLGAVESPPMAEIVTRMLRYTDNTTAEMLLKEIGRRSSGSARSQAVLGVYDVLHRLMEIPTDGVVVSDGSGLSLQSRLSCDLIAELLRRAGPLSPLVRGMSVVGERGTLRDCPVEADTPEATVWAHGGARQGASGLAGVTVADNGDVLTFVTISNTEELIGDLDLCNDLHKEVIAAVAGHPHGSTSADDLLVPLPAVTSIPAPS